MIIKILYVFRISVFEEEIFNKVYNYKISFDNYNFLIDICLQYCKLYFNMMKRFELDVECG